jgi:hypothetical protein
MTDFRFQSPAQRRRAGLAGSVHGHVSTRGVNPVSEDSMAIALGGMAQTGNPRIPMQSEAVQQMVNASADYTSGATMHPRFSQPVNDPAFFPTARPEPVLLGPAGPRYGIRVNMNPPVLAEAGPTTANGRQVGGGGGTSASFAGGAAG